MYKNIRIINKDQIEKLHISAQEEFNWVDKVLKSKSDYILPVKTRIPLKDTDYFNVMPCVLPSENVLGLKVVTRNENRRKRGELNIDGDILLYSYDDFEPLALIDGGYITTIRTAAVAAHSMLTLVPDFDVIAMVGLGRIGMEIGRILFDLINRNKRVTIKLYKYKDHAEKFIEKFKEYENLNFIICETYQDLMKGSDVIFSSVTYIEEDFCAPELYNKKCTIIPVHLRGFRECDRCFDHIITSDLESIKKFGYYSDMKKISYIDDIIKDLDSYRPASQTIIYNLGLAVYDLYFASKIFEKISHKDA